MKLETRHHHAFPASARLKQSRDFAAVRQDGRRLVSGSLVANWKTLPDGCRSRLGLITSKKLGGAVVRNRARRLLRESWRLHQHELCRPVMLVLVARRSIVGKSFEDVERNFLSLLRRSSMLKAT